MAAEYFVFVTVPYSTNQRVYYPYAVLKHIFKCECCHLVWHTGFYVSAWHPAPGATNDQIAETALTKSCVTIIEKFILKMLRLFHLLLFTWMVVATTPSSHLPVSHNVRKHTSCVKVGLTAYLCPPPPSHILFIFTSFILDSDQSTRVTLLCLHCVTCGYLLLITQKR